MPVYFARLIIAISLLFPVISHAATVSVPFNGGFVGTVGSSAGKATNILVFDTIGVDKAYFIQVSDTDQFGGTQGNDLSGTLRMRLTTGETIDIAGALNWRHVDSQILQAFGFIPDPANGVQTITYSGGTVTLDSSSNYGLQTINSTLTYTNGTNISGNAATVSLLDELNAYLAVTTTNAPSGPVTVNSLSTSVTTPTITGTVTLIVGEALTVTVNGMVYTTSNGLSIGAGTWSLAIPPESPLAAGVYEVDAVIENDAGYILGDATNNELVIVGSASPLTSVISASTLSIAADGVSTSVLTVQLKDALGDNLTSGGDTVVISTTKGTISATTDNDDGTYSATLTSSNAAEAATISATLNTVDITDTENVSFFGGVSLVTTSITASLSEILGDGSSTSIITVQLKDGVGSDITSSGGVVTLFTTAGSIGVVTDNNDGSYTATLTSSTSVGTVSITGKLDGANLTQTTIVNFLETIPPVITGPSGNAGDASSAISVNENQTSVTAMVADEAVSWSISGGDDEGKFTIDAGGVLTFIEAPNYEMPKDTGADNTYVVIVWATDVAGNQSKQTITVTVDDVVEAGPAITGPSGNAGDSASAISVNENQASVTTLTADKAVVWSISGGDDGAKFAINELGEVTFLTEPDFEIPTDNGANNTYIVIIAATDVDENISSQTITVTVDDVVEAGPAITGPSGNAGDANGQVSVDENQTAVTTFTTDSTVTWSLESGADAGKFEIDADGVLTFIAAPDFEVPEDIGTDNDYLVTVVATDNESGLASTQVLTVSVRNLTDTPDEAFDINRDAVTEIITSQALTGLRVALRVNESAVGDARERFILATRSTTECLAAVDDEFQWTLEDDEEEHCTELATRNGEAFDVDGAVDYVNGRLSVVGDFYGATGASSGEFDRLVFGRFDMVRESTGTVTGALNARVAWERLNPGKGLVGYFVNMNASQSKISNSLIGEHFSYGVSVGAYGVRQIEKSAYLEGYVSAGIGRNNLDISDDVMNISGAYLTKTFMVGGAISGVLEYSAFELWPSLSFSYGLTNIGLVHLDASAFDATAEVSLDAGYVSLGKVSFEPEFRIPLETNLERFSTSILKIVPSIGCEYARTETAKTSACGGGLLVGLSATSLDEMTNFEITAQKEVIGETTISGLSLSIEHKF